MKKLLKQIIDFILKLFNYLNQKYSLYNEISVEKKQHGFYLKHSQCGMNMSKCKLKFY